MLFSHAVGKVVELVTGNNPEYTDLKIGQKEWDRPVMASIRTSILMAMKDGLKVGDYVVFTGMTRASKSKAGNAYERVTVSSVQKSDEATYRQYLAPAT